MNRKASTPPERQRRLQAAFADYLRDPDNHPAPDGIEERRLAIYRRLFFGNLRNLMAKNFPVLRRMLDDGEWDRLIRELMVKHRSTTPLFPEIGSEMLEFLSASGEQWLRQRPWMAELAQWEYLETLARLHEGEVAAPEPTVAGVLERPIELNPTLQIARFAWPVHRISPGFVPAEPLAQPINLLVYRRHNDKVAFERVNDLSLRFLQLVLARPGSTGLERLTALAEEAGTDPRHLISAGGEKILQHLTEQEVICLR